jgi:hypothetical protein
MERIDTKDKVDINSSIFTLSDMLNCWEESKLSFAKEIGNDMSEDEEDGIPVFKNKQDYFKEKYFIDIKK